MLFHRDLCRAAVVAFTMLLATAGCTTDSPTAPQQNPPPPSSQPPAGVWNISVTSDKSALRVGSTDSAIISVQVRRAADNSLPPDDSTVVVRSNLGEFGNPGSGARSAVLGLVQGRSQVDFFAGTNEGSATIEAQLESSVGSTSVTLSGGVDFFLSSVRPSVGRASGGEVVEILGNGFVEPLRVTMSGVFAEVLGSTATSVQIRTPAIEVAAGGSQTVSISVSIAVNTTDERTDTLPASFTYSADPSSELAVFSMTPNSGPNEGGTRTTLFGQGFESPMQVLFGGGSVGSFSGVEAVLESISPTQLVVVTPAATGFGIDNRDQEVGVLVRNLATGAGATLDFAFQYGADIQLTSIAPSKGPAEGGQLVTLFGQGFDEPVAVGLAGVAQSVVSVTGTEIIVRTTAVEIDVCEDIEGEAEVTNIETGATARGPLYVYEVDNLRPFITQVTPTRLSGDGGTEVSIVGGNFERPIQVTMDGVIVDVVDVVPTLVTFLSPPYNGRLDTESCDANGDGVANGERFIDTVTDVEVNVTLLGSSCDVEGAPQVRATFVPADTSCRDDTPPALPVASFTTTVSGLTVAFNNTSSNATTYLWRFGDGGTSTEAEPTHTYGAPGSYLVLLTASNTVGSDTISQTVTVPPN